MTDTLPSFRWAPLKPDADGWYDLRVVGTRSGPDADLKQWAVRVSRAGDPVTLVREPDNPFDAHAIAVVDQRGRMMGYIKAKRAKMLAPALDAGRKLEAQVAIDGDIDAYLAGLRISIREHGAEGDL